MCPVVVHHLVVLKVFVGVITMLYNRARQRCCQQALQGLSRKRGVFGIMGHVHSLKSRHLERQQPSHTAGARYKLARYP